MTLTLTPDDKVDYGTTYSHVHEMHESYQKRNWGLNYMKFWQPTNVLRPGDSVLELGCGNGKLCKRLANMGHSVTGVDVVAGDYARDGYVFHVQDITSTIWPPIETDKFDVGMAFDVFEHLDYSDLMITLSNFFRVSDRQVVSIPHCKSVGKLHRIIKPLDWWLDKLNVFADGWKLIHTRLTDKGGEISVLVRGDGDS